MPSLIPCKVKHVLNGNVLILYLKDSAGTPYDQLCSLAGITCPQIANSSDTYKCQDEPGAFQARERIRSFTIGKTGQVDILGTKKDGSVAATVYISGQDLALLLVAEGLATVDKQTTICPANIDYLLAAEASAQEQDLNLWSKDQNALKQRKMHWSYSDPAYIGKWVQDHMGESLDAIIEHVRDGRTLRCCFVDSELFCQVLITGIDTDELKPDAPNSYAVKAKHFVEARLLGRRIPFQIDGTDGYGNVFATPKHPNGCDIGILLIEAGLVTLHESGALLHTTADHRAALKKAQTAKAGRWATVQETGATELKKSPQTLAYYAVVLEVFSGDCVTVVPVENADSTPSVSRAVQEQTRVYLSSIRAPRPKRLNREGEPWANESQKCVISLTAGKVCKVTVDYMRQPLPSALGGELPPASDDQGNMHFVTITANSKHVNVELCRRGLARAVRHRIDEERSCQYEAILAAEQAAIEGKRGIHSSTPAKVHRINDLTAPNSSKRLKDMEILLRHEDHLQATIEQVMNGGKYRIFCPGFSTLMNFALSGVRAPLLSRPGQEGQLFAEESLAWAKLNLLYKKVNVSVSACDRSGTYIGLMYPSNVPFGQRPSIQEMLLRAGFAHTSEEGLARCTIAKELIESEQDAIAARSGMWILPEVVAEFGNVQEAMNAKRTDLDSDTKFNAIEYPSCVVTHIVDTSSFFLQTDPIEAERIRDACDAAAATYAGGHLMLNHGDVIIIRNPDEESHWYRAKVLSVKRDKHMAKVFLVDYGNQIEVSESDCILCPPDMNLVSMPQQVISVGLALGRSITDDALDAFEDLITGQTLRCLCVGAPDRRGITPAIIYLEASASANSVNEELLKQGHIRLSKQSLADRSISVPDEVLRGMQKAQEYARSNRQGMWFYGDVGDSDDEDN